MPGNDEGRPGEKAASHVENPGAGFDAPSMPHVSDIVSEMRRLVADLDGQHRRERQARAEGFRDGLALGQELADAAWRIGYHHRDHQIAVNHERLAAEALGERVPHADLEARRWGGRREDFGRPRPGDFPGVGAQEVA